MSVRTRRLASYLASVTAAAAGVLVVCVSASQCNVYGPSLLLPVEDAAPPPSSLATIPARTGKDDAPEASQQTYSLIAVMQSIDLGIGSAANPVDAAAPLPPLGWNLDGVDTCPGPPSCNQAAGTARNCDDDAGRDHTGLELFRKLGPTALTGLTTANEALMTGQYGIIIEVTQYNGQPNDAQVTVAIYASSGVLGPDGGVPQLAHNGTDAWTIDPRYLNSGNSLIGVNCGNANASCTAVYYTDTAYVTGGVLVASLPEVPFTFGGRANIGGAVMDLYQPYVIGTLEPFSFPNGGSSWKITNGTVSGRWQSAKLLANMATIPDPTSEAGVFLCGPDDVAYQFLKSYICSLQDITSTSPDNMGAPCDAISMTFGFTAEPAQLGAVTALPATPAGCCTNGPCNGGGIPFNDTCQ